MTLIVLSLVISDVLLVLLTTYSLAADDSFLVNFIPSFTLGFENLNILGMTFVFVTFVLVLVPLSSK